ncbi:MAG: hypothetical protein WD492_12750 [Alkalispirochaeta sp.]
MAKDQDYVEAGARQNDKGEWVFTAVVRRPSEDRAIEDLVKVVKDIKTRFDSEGFPTLEPPLRIR